MFEAETGIKARWLLSHRADIHACLRDAATRPIPGTSTPAFHLSSQVVAVDAQAGTVTFQDGTTESADLIIGADGLHVRQHPHHISQRSSSSSSTVRIDQGSNRRATCYQHRAELLPLPRADREGPQQPADPVLHHTRRSQHSRRHLRQRGQAQMHDLPLPPGIAVKSARHPPIRAHQRGPTRRLAQPRSAPPLLSPVASPPTTH